MLETPFSLLKAAQTVSNVKKVKPELLATEQGKVCIFFSLSPFKNINDFSLNK